MDFAFNLNAEQVGWWSISKSKDMPALLFQSTVIMVQLLYSTLFLRSVISLNFVSHKASVLKGKIFCGPQTFFGVAMALDKIFEKSFGLLFIYKKNLLPGRVSELFKKADFRILNFYMSMRFEFL